MDKIFTGTRIMRTFLAFAFVALSIATYAQTYTYTKGSLTVEFKVFNPCGSPTPDNGYVDVKILAASGGVARILLLDGPGPVVEGSIDVNVGDTYRYNPTSSLPDGICNYIIRDTPLNTINSYAEPVAYPALVLTDLSSVSLTQDILINNTACVDPTTGQIEASIVGGSKVLPGGGSFSYEWNSTNGLAGLPVTGTTAGATPLNLAVLMGRPGLPGGTYTLKVTDLYSACAEVQRSYTITDPSPTSFPVSPSPSLSICQGEDITLSMSGSEVGVTYTITQNGVATTHVFTGTGAAPFVMTFPSAGFSDTDVIRVRAATGICTAVLMPNPVLLRINDLPTISGAAITDACQGSSQTTFTYSGTSATPNRFSIDFDLTAQGQGFVDIVDAALTASPVTIAIPPAAAPNTYNGVLTVRNATTGCVSLAIPITVRILSNPTITLLAGPVICFGTTTTAPLAYSGTTGNPNQYSINFDGIAEGQGFTDVPNTNLPASPIQISIPAGAQPDVYNGLITVVNTTTGCFSTTQPFTVTINPTPGVTLTPIPAICQGTTSAILAYSAPVGGADQYSIDFNGAANTAGLADVPATTLPASPISITVPAGIAANAYVGTITVINSSTGCFSAPLPITLTVNPSPTITVTDLSLEVCLGTTSAPLAYTATSGGPTTYSLDFDLTAQGQGFVDVVDQLLPASPITVVIPGGATPNTYNAILTVRNGGTTCVGAGQAVTVTIHDTPAIALTNPDPEICRGTLVAPMPYTGVAGGANQYTIDFNGLANAAGFVDVPYTNLPASPISIAVSAATVPGVYNGTLTVRNNTTGCVSSSLPISVTINETPTITLSAIPAICQGTTSVNLGYTGTTGAPTEYTIDFSTAANTAGFVDVPTTSLPATPIVITVPAGAAPATYTATVVVTNPLTGCPSAPQTISIIINGNPTIAITNPNPAVCLGASSALLAYTGTTGSPDEYSIDFDGAAQLEGFADVVDQNLPASPITIIIPGTADAGTYNATLTITNSGTGCGSTSLPITVTINPTPGATLTPIPAICQGTTTAVLAYSAPVGGADQYSIDFNGAANLAGLADVPVTALPASPINIAVPAGIAASTYNGFITIINSLTGCTSATLPISITVNPSPTITVTDLSLEVCLGATSAPLAYTATSGGPTTYSLDFDLTAQGQGFVDVVDQLLPASPITVVIPGGATPNTYNAILTVRNGGTTCVGAGQAVTVTIHDTPAIALTNPDPEICRGTLVAPMPYTGVAGGANQYTIDFDGPANAAGFADVPYTNLPASPINIAVSAATVAGVYNGTLTVRNNTTGCVSSSLPITVTINETPTITLSAIPAICQGTTSVNLGYTGTTGAPTEYTIDFSTAANTAGFVDVPTTALPATPIVIAVPAGAAPATYTATVVVTNPLTGCPSAPQTISIIINGNPTIAITNPNPAVCLGASSALLAYTGTTGSPDEYSIDFDGAAQLEGFADVVDQNLPASPITIIIPGTADAGVYNATLTITNAGTGCGSTSLPITVTINNTPGATLTPIPAICQGTTTAVLAYSAPVGGADQYSIDFNGAANLAGLADVPVTALPASPINITVPAVIAANTYTGTITIINSLTGCTSATLPISITVNPIPTITFTGLSESVCFGTTSLSLAYTAVTGLPVTYSIDFDNTANLAGFTDVIDQVLPASPITIVIPAAAAAGSYTAGITVSSAAPTCSSNAQILTIDIEAQPSITLVDADPEVCSGTTTVPFAYSAVAGGADEYTIDFDVNAENEGFADVPTTSLPASPISVTVPGGAAAGTYNATIIVSNSTSGCVATAIPVTITINALPTLSITPIAPVCVGTTSVNMTFTSAGTGASGTITIDFDTNAENAGFADVNVPLTASPFAITIPATAGAGTYNATVTVTNGTTTCESTVQNIAIRLNPAPTATISGPASVCAGTATQLVVTFTGTAPWTFTFFDGTATSLPITTPINTFIIPIANPTATVDYVIDGLSDASTCTGITGNTFRLNVNQPPLANLAVDATIDPLCSGGVSEVRVAGSQLGVSYQLRNNADDSNIGAPVIGTGGVILLPTSALTATTTFNVLATATGCTPVELTATVTIDVAGAINAGIGVSADTDPICSGTGTNITLTTSENGVLYQLRNDANDFAVGSAVPGTGVSISLPTGNLTATTTFNVFASNGTCSIELTNKETVTVGSSPDATLDVEPAIDPLCTGGSTQITVELSQVGVSYQLRDNAGNTNVGAAVAGTGGTISLNTGVLNATTTFNILATAPGCGSVMLTELATVTVSGTIDATLALTAADSPICAGSATTIELANAEAGVDYQLRDNATNATVGLPVTGTGVNISFPTGNLSATTSFNVLANNGACSIQMDNIVTVSVDASPDPNLTITPTLNPLCVGGTTIIRILASEAGVTYQLRNDADDSDVGLPVFGNGSTLLLPTGPLSADASFNVLATNGVCAPVQMTTIVNIVVSGTVDAGLTVSSSSASICAGTGTFIQVLASETGVTYQLMNLSTSTPVGSALAGNGATLNLPTGNLTASATFGVIASNGSCSIQLTDTEDITVNPSPDITLAVNAQQALICSNTLTTITIANSQTGIQYQLRNDAGDVNIGSPIAGTGSTISISTGALTATTTFNVFAIAGTCSAELTNKATVTIRAANDPACGGGGPGPTDCTNFSAIQPSIVTQPSCNDRDAGEVAFNISRADGTPTTFRILWTINGTTQTKFTSSTATFDDLSSGLYTYTVIDEGNGRTCGPVDFFLDLKTQVEILEKQVTANVTCFGGTDGNAILKVDGTTTGEYWYRYVAGGVESTAQTFTPGAPLPGGLPADDNAFIIIKVDDNFNFTCPDTVMVRIRNTYAKIDFAVAATDVTTCNGTDGTISVTGITGGDSGTNPLQSRLKKAVPFSTDPSGYIIVSDFANLTSGAATYSDLGQGNYIVDVRDHRDCIQSKPINVQAPGQVPLAVVSITAIDATCANAGESGAIRVTISEAGNYKVAVSKDPLNVPADSEFINYASPSLPNVVFADLSAGAYYLYITSSTTTCPTRTDAIMINGVIALADFEVVSNCNNVNLTIANITGQANQPFVIEVYRNDDPFKKIDSLKSTSIPLTNSVTFEYSPTAHTFLATPDTYRFVMVQTQVTGAGSCKLISDAIVYSVTELLNVTLGTVKPSFPQPKHTGSIEIANVTGGTRFDENNQLYYEVSLTTADNDIVIKDWERLKLNTQNAFTHLYDYLPPGVYRVKVRDNGGCMKIVDVEIPLETSIFVPNIFTPNNDGANDEFEILNLPVTGTHQLIITNRWGNEVFKSGDYREGNFWNGDNASDGIYYYRLKVDGGKVLNGWVEIVRGAKP